MHLITTCAEGQKAIAKISGHGDSLVIALPHPFTVLHFAADEGVVAVNSFSLPSQNWAQRFASQGLQFSTHIFFGMIDTCKVEKCGHNVDFASWFPVPTCRPMAEIAQG